MECLYKEQVENLLEIMLVFHVEVYKKEKYRNNMFIDSLRAYTVDALCSLGLCNNPESFLFCVIKEEFWHCQNTPPFGLEDAKPTWRNVPIGCWFLKSTLISAKLTHWTWKSLTHVSHSSCLLVCFQSQSSLIGIR